ncbi:MAG: hypothetical protein HS120_04175 [Burkholderiales bacterium]|nr:hypothetical protein [Burkholderiales bacterium]
MKLSAIAGTAWYRQFDGPLDNPGLNILAIRTSQQSDSGADSSDVIDQPSQDSTVNALAVRSGMRVEAGVEINVR